MTDQDLLLRNRFRAISDDAPAEAPLLETVHTGYVRHLRRRRRSAVGSVVLVVLVVAGATTLLTPDRSPAPATSPAPTVTATLGPRAGAGTTALPPQSQLVLFAGVDTASPVSVPASWVSYDHDGPDVVAGPSSLQVNWAGKAPTAMETLDVKAGTTGTGQYRGYLITTDKPAINVYAPGYNTDATVKAITISGHAAELLTAPKGSFDNTYATPAQTRIAWQLPDGRWIQVWAVGESDSVLTAFASAITDAPTPFPANLSIGLTLKGYTTPSSTFSSYVSQMAGPGLMLCKPTPVASGAASSLDAAPSASSGVGGSDLGNCLNVYADVADGGFGAGIVMGAESNAQFVAESTPVDVGGVLVHVNAKYQAAWTRWGKATIVVQSPAGVTLSSADLAALTASVRLSPSLGVKNEPDAMVESSLSEQAAQADQTESTR